MSDDFVFSLHFATEAEWRQAVRRFSVGYAGAWPLAATTEPRHIHFYCDGTAPPPGELVHQRHHRVIA